MLAWATAARMVTLIPLAVSFAWHQPVISVSSYTERSSGSDLRPASSSRTRAFFATSSRAREHQLAFALVFAQCRCGLEPLSRPSQPPQAGEDVSAPAGQQTVATQCGYVGERVDQLEPGLGAEGHRHRHGAIELHDRRAS